MKELASRNPSVVEQRLALCSRSSWMLALFGMGTGSGSMGPC